jgi:N-acetylmuramoyl-L-alanine amidase
VAITETLDPGYRVLTPCGNDRFITGGTPLHAATVVVDPGHGGPVDTGSVGQNGLPEKVVNLRVARLVAEILNDAGIETVLTRTDDYASPLFVRANLADSLDAEVMVSIHHNGPTPGPSAEPGTEVFVQDGSEASARLGGLLWESAREALGIFDVTWAAAEDAGVMTVLNSRGSNAYGILRHPETTTVLVELGYMSNPPEAELFATPLYPRIAAKAVAGAVTSFLEAEENAGSGFVEGRVFNPGPGIGRDVCTDPGLG